ncbi:hypothetical protein M427DRAFT_308467 [Gonapodya prolifera JEL478]|uniref:Uncharacterized protein n=1 Tax=Gonapodya prolifera (strain JEL478) TaxID=1344416 RepID=A0A139AGX2_GONPJ|nr:hypothetical protein M427DRAFT_308467 [Gonapodya prolifera JEL478]|eukprot:KXS16061.1 hypothetical protein M427DRAFT_308467 [Gonapodya prolifera JEL478]
MCKSWHRSTVPQLFSTRIFRDSQRTRVELGAVPSDVPLTASPKSAFVLTPFHLVYCTPVQIPVPSPRNRPLDGPTSSRLPHSHSHPTSDATRLTHIVPFPPRASEVSREILVRSRWSTPSSQGMRVLHGDPSGSTLPRSHCPRSPRIAPVNYAENNATG